MLICYQNQHMRMRDPNRIGEDLRAWMQQHDLTEEAVARKFSRKGSHLGISQSWVSRIANGRFRRLTPRVRQIAIYANIPVEEASRQDRTGASLIKDAVAEVWDGSLDHANVIARLIRVARGLTH
jgi:transcriptional regulator with XRE-family HTH domain